MRARQFPPQSAQLARQLLGDLEQTLRFSNWAEIDGDTPEAAAEARGWVIEACHANGVVAREPGAVWVVARHGDRTVAVLAMQHAGALPSIRNLCFGINGEDTIAIVAPPAGWRVTAPGMYGRNGMVVHLEQIDDEALVALCSSAHAPTAADADAVALAFGGAGATVVARNPVALGGRLRYARVIAMLG
ncbi:MAG: hypothetical protein Q8Q09_07765 [Deltaproteobacteria bacterium]|nr:hypothetical protein [Deltaproteobacteria bacterium]